MNNQVCLFKWRTFSVPSHLTLPFQFDLDFEYNFALCKIPHSTPFLLFP